MSLVVWRHFVWNELPDYVNRYVRQHTGAPVSERPRPTLLRYFGEHDRPAVRIVWDDGWHLSDFDGWNERASEHTGEGD